MKNNKMTIDKYSPTIYPVELHVIKYPDIQKLKKLYNIEFDYNEDHSWAVTLTGAYKEDKRIIIVLLSDELIKTKDVLQKVNTCSHEALHFVMDVARYVGLEESTKSEESYTYLQGWGTEMIFSTLIKK